MDWLLDHRAEFELLVLRTLGEETADLIDWSAPRLLCIAGGFTRYDEHAVQQMNRNIELIRYRRFGEGLLTLEMVNAVSAATPASTATRASGSLATKGGAQKTFSQVLASLDGPLLDLYEALRDHILELGDDVQEKTLKRYVAFKRLKNFACIDVRLREGAVLMYLKVDPGSVTLTDGFTRDVREISHYGTGDLEVTMRTPADLERAKALLQESYDAS